MKSIKTGDEVIYKSDAQPEYTGQKCKAIDFDLEHRLMSLECSDGQIIAAFWDEVDVG